MEQERGSPPKNIEATDLRIKYFRPASVEKYIFFISCG